MVNNYAIRLLCFYFILVVLTQLIFIVVIILIIVIALISNIETNCLKSNVIIISTYYVVLIESVYIISCTLNDII